MANTNKPTSRVSSLTKSIDAVLDSSSSNPNASTASKIVRPLAKLRPSWIGPPRAERSTTPGAPTMKQHVRVDFDSPGLKPPVYILTNLSDPAWETVEMKAERLHDGSYVFSKAFDVEEGEYQYKFRLGPGDWWVCDESKSMVDDGHGNKNNLLVIKPVEKKLELPKPSLKSKSSTESVWEGRYGSEKPQLEQTKPAVPKDPEKQYILMDHEKFAPRKNSKDADDDGGDSSSSYCSDDDSPDSERPLLAHEQLTPKSPNQEPPPASKYGPTGPGSTHGPHIAEEADLNDPTLEPFPKTYPAIVALLHSISAKQDAVSHDNDALLDEREAEMQRLAALNLIREVEEEEEEELKEEALERETSHRTEHTKDSHPTKKDIPWLEKGHPALAAIVGILIVIAGVVMVRWWK